MKLMHENKFSTLVTRIKNWYSGSKLKTLWGKIEDFFFIDYYDEEFEDEIIDDEEMFEYDEDDFNVDEANGDLYHFEAHNVMEHPFVKTLLANGYTVIVSLGLLTKEERDSFVRNLRLDLFKLGINCNQVNENCVIVAPKSVEIVNFEEKKETKKGKVLYLDDYRKMK